MFPKNTSLILGLGKTGFSCVNYFVKKGLPIAVMDTRLNPPLLETFKKQFPQIPVFLGEFKEEYLLQAKEIVLSPGLSLKDPAIQKALEKNIPVIGDVELFLRNIHAPVIAITGTNAKGTVTTLVGEMLKAAGKKVCVGGNIGIPVLDLLDHETPEFYVLELSSFQLETTTSLKAKVATILNISPDHFDRYDSMDEYIAAKHPIYKNAENCVYNREDSKTFPNSSQVFQKIITFGLDEPTENNFGIRKINHEDWLVQGKTNLLPIKNLKIKGKHNWANALAALAIVAIIELPIEQSLKALQEFKGLDHRCEWILEHDHITWINDSKGANVGATLAAIEGLGKSITGKIIWIAGGLSKGADFSPLKKAVKTFVRTAVLIGKDAPIIQEALKNETEFHHAKNLSETILIAKTLAKPGDCVLLSPACTSLDMFKNAEERGEIFKTLVRSLVNEIPEHG